MADTYSPIPALADPTSGFRARDARVDRRVRITGLAFAISIEALLILLLFAIGWGWRDESELAETLTTFEAQDFGPEDPAPAKETPAEAASTRAEPVPQPEPEPQPVPPTIPPLLTPPVAISPVTLPATPAPTPPPPVPEDQPRTPAPPASPPGRAYGPVDTGGGSNTGSDSQRVGSASNGEPLYAARWYREPTRRELAGYLSTATGPATALIACRTVPDFRVEDCELIGESPQGSQIGRAVLAATWQFRVRPARIGGRSQVGSWVRIRINYTRANAADGRARGF